MCHHDAQECGGQVYCFTADYPVGPGVSLDPKRADRAQQGHQPHPG